MIYRLMTVRYIIIKKTIDEHKIKVKYNHTVGADNFCSSSKNCDILNDCIGSFIKFTNDGFS